MDNEAPKCSRGWAARCAASHGKRCKCACGGKNHGGIRTDASGDTLPTTPHDVLEYDWTEERPSRPQFPVADDRVIDLVRLTRPGLHGDVTEARVYLDGSPLPRRLVLHSPTGFEWGYAGSGPADLALNILALVVSPKEANRFHQDFKRERIATMPHDGGRIALLDVRVWLDKQYDAVEKEELWTR